MLVAGTNGLVIDAPPTAKVILRKIAVQGLGKQGLSGIKVVNAAAVYLENVKIK